MLTKIGDANTEPTFTTILIIHIELNSNTAAVYSMRGDGLLGHLTLTINTIYYVSCIKGNDAFGAPINPPSVPVHKDKANKFEISKENQQRKARHLKFVLRRSVDVILRNLIIAAVPGIFIATKKKPVTGFGNVTCIKLLTHLHDTYGQITEKELEEESTDRY
jgi:hypothetical protein